MSLREGLPLCDGVCDPALISLFLPACLSLRRMIACIIFKFMNILYQSSAILRTSSGLNLDLEESQTG